MTDEKIRSEEPVFSVCASIPMDQPQGLDSLGGYGLPDASTQSLADLTRFSPSPIGPWTGDRHARLERVGVAFDSHACATSEPLGSPNRAVLRHIQLSH
jgi:hypothetical protein